MKNLFVNTYFTYLDETTKGTELTCEAIEDMDLINLKFPILCNYFEPELVEGATKKWPNKKIKISYDENVSLSYYNFRAFKRIVFDNEDPKSYL